MRGKPRNFLSSWRIVEKAYRNYRKVCCISFNGNKIISSGGRYDFDNDESLAEKAKYYSTQAKDDGLKYIHNNVGYNLD